MSRTLVTVDGDTADLIALRGYGFTGAATEALLDANPAICAAGPVLSAGMVVTLPAVSQSTPAATVQLWD